MKAIYKGKLYSIEDHAPTNGDTLSVKEKEYNTLRNHADKLAECIRHFVDYYSQANRVYQLGNGQASKSFHEMKAALAEYQNTKGGATNE